MNRLKGYIKSIAVSGKMSVVSVEIENGIALQSIVIDTPASANYLQKGKEIFALFKETEVVISTDKKPQISIENQLKGIVTQIEKGSLLSELTIQTGQHFLTAIITTATAESLRLQEGSDILAMVKVNDIMLSD